MCGTCTTAVGLPAHPSHPPHAPPSPALQILKVDTERNALVIKGCVPGKPGSIIEITQAKVVGTNC